MIDWQAILINLTSYPVEGRHGRYMNGLIHGSIVIALLWLVATVSF